MARSAILFSFSAVAYAARVVSHAEDSGNHADAHEAEINPRAMSMPRFTQMQGGRSVIPDVLARHSLTASRDASQPNLDGEVSIQDAGYHPKLRADWKSDLYNFEVEDMVDDWLRATGKPKDETLPNLILARSSPTPVIRNLGVPGPVMSAAVSERPVLERAPPAPPPPPASDFEGQGGGENSSLHLLSDSEAAELFNDWSARTRIYSRTSEFGNAGLAALHTKSLEELDLFRSFIQNGFPGSLLHSLGLGWGPVFLPAPDWMKKNIVFGHYSDDRKKMIALAGGYVSSRHGGALVIKHISVNPAELNDLHEEDFTAGFMMYMKRQLRRLADALDLELVLELMPLETNGGE